MIKFVLIMILSIVFGFGFWYLIFWFITTDPNLFLWHWVTKTIYLIFSMAASQGIFQGLSRNEY